MLLVAVLGTSSALATSTSHTLRSSSLLKNTFFVASEKVAFLLSPAVYRRWRDSGARLRSNFTGDVDSFRYVRIRALELSVRIRSLDYCFVAVHAPTGHNLSEQAQERRLFLDMMTAYSQSNTSG